jgi:hypothetical protein
MMNVRHRESKPALRDAAIALGLSNTIPAIARARQANTSALSKSSDAILESIVQSEERLGVAASDAPQANSDFIITITWKGYSR